ncbi:DeoR/GlpR family DNA-binding transcription regulator [Haloimpatiens sp. FM7315]|uniref:DeoR/GlpR family DNA-binding transcription regulator n=1 Tax=Haloimpatiens sp. FM7315 TaxID=3298609 RepID=UPI00370BF71B
MFAQERLDEIVKLLNKEGKVIVKDLSAKFTVTEDCIRKDLKILENENILKRTYGGGILVQKSATILSIGNRLNLNINNKRKIAEKAFKLIENGDSVFLDISSTNVLLAQMLSASNKNITIITNMIDIVNSFSSNKTIKVICTGGTYNSELNGFTGSMTIDSISNYRVDKSFIGSCGINIFDKTITTFDMEDGNTKKQIMDSSKAIYLVMENKKFHLEGMYRFAHIADIKAVITEKKPENDIICAFQEMGIDVV